MTSSNTPDVPQPVKPPETWVHYGLYCRVKQAIAALPLHFSTDTFIEGISATDIFTLNSALGATIEDLVVRALNQHRGLWEPRNEYSSYGFIRQAQTFPDVLLRDMTKQGRDSIILGLELKGWYLLSKEKEPSFRYTVTPGACADADLLVCVPWALKNILSGSPVVYEPYVISAKYAALLRNHHWEHVRRAKSDTAIRHPDSENVRPYPSKHDSISDVALSDDGGNFGRYARLGLMDDYMIRLLETPLCGIPAGAWLDFFRVFTESKVGDEVRTAIRRLRKKAQSKKPTGDPDDEHLSVCLRILDVLEDSI